MSDSLRARLLAGREQNLELPSGKSVRVRRPAETQMPAVLLHGGLDDILACVVDWPGWTEADILGPSLGGDSQVPFDSALWADLAKDHTEWCKAVADKVKGMCSEFIAAKEAAGKN